MQQQLSSKSEWLVNQSTDASSRFISAFVLFGRRVAAADGVIDESEKEMLLRSIRERLHLADDVEGLLVEILNEAVEGKVSEGEDREAILELVSGFGDAELLHLFAFGCEMAGADDIFQQEEQALLTEFATILGIETTDRNILFAVHCDQALSEDVNRNSVDDLLVRLSPSRLDVSSRPAQGLAGDNARAVEEFASQMDDEEDSRRDRSGRSRASVGESSEAFSSQIRQELEQSPLRQKLEDCIREVQSLPSEVIGKERQRRLNRLLETAEDQQFRIAVVGNFSSGKSTLLNALCRDSRGELLPTSTIPCTGTVSILRHNDTERFIVRDADGNERPVDPDEFRDSVTLPEDMERAEALREPDAEAVIAEYPLPLCEEGVELIDTPGLNENPRRTEITDQYLRKADAVVYVLQSQQLLSKQEREFIQGELRERIDHGNLFFVVNYWDQVDGTEEEEKVRKRAHSFAEEFYPDEFHGQLDQRIHFLSAKKIVDHTAEGRDSSPYISALDGFESAIGRYLAEAKGDARWHRKADDLMRELVHIQENAQALGQEGHSDVESEIEEVQQALKRFRRTKEQFKDEKEQAQRLIHETQREVLRSLTSEFRNFRGEIPRLIRSRSQDWETDASPIWGKSQIQEDFQEQLKEDLQLLIRSWAEQHAQAELKHRLSGLKQELNRQFEDVNEQMRKLQQATGAVGEKATQGSGEDEGAFVQFMKGAGGWVAGGPVGALVGTTLDTEDLAINFATNFAVGVTMALFGVGGPVTLILGAAVVGIGQLVMGKDKAIDKIREKIVEQAIDALPEIMEEAEHQFSNEIGGLFEKMSRDVGEAIDAQLDDIESQIKNRKKLLEEKRRDKRKAEQQRQEWVELAERIETDLAVQVEEVSNLSFEAAKSETESSSFFGGAGLFGDGESGSGVEAGSSRRRTYSVAAVFLLLLTLAFAYLFLI